LDHFSFIPDFEELEKMVNHLEEETKNLREKLTQREQVMVVVMSDHEVKLSDQKKCLELKEESWKMERINFVKQLSDLRKSMELKEESSHQRGKTPIWKAHQRVGTWETEVVQGVSVSAHCADAAGAMCVLHQGVYLIVKFSFDSLGREPAAVLKLWKAGSKWEGGVFMLLIDPVLLPVGEVLVGY